MRCAGHDSEKHTEITTLRPDPSLGASSVRWNDSRASQSSAPAAPVEAAARAAALSQLSSSSTGPARSARDGRGVLRRPLPDDLSQMTACFRSLEEGLGSQPREAQRRGELGTRTVMAQSPQRPEPSQFGGLSAARVPARSTCSSDGDREKSAAGRPSAPPARPRLGPPATPLRRSGPAGKGRARLGSGCLASGLRACGYKGVQEAQLTEPRLPSAGRVRSAFRRCLGFPFESSHTVALTHGSDSAGPERCSGHRRAQGSQRRG